MEKILVKGAEALKWAVGAFLQTQTFMHYFMNTPDIGSPSLLLRDIYRIAMQELKNEEGNGIQTPISVILVLKDNAAVSTFLEITSRKSYTIGVIHYQDSISQTSSPVSLGITTCAVLSQAIRDGNFPARSVIVLDLECGRPTPDTLIVATDLIRLARGELHGRSSGDGSHLAAGTVSVLSLSPRAQPIWDNDKWRAICNVMELKSTCNFTMPIASHGPFDTGFQKRHPLANAILRAVLYEDWTKEIPQAEITNTRNRIVLCLVPPHEAILLQRAIESDEMDTFPQHIRKVLSRGKEHRPHVLRQDNSKILPMDVIIHKLELEANRRLILLVDPSLRFFPVMLPDWTVWITPTSTTRRYFDSHISNFVIARVPYTTKEISSLCHLGRTMLHTNPVHLICDSDMDVQGEDMEQQDDDVVWCEHYNEALLRLFENFRKLDDSWLCQPKGNAISLQQEVIWRLENGGLLESNREGDHALSKPKGTETVHWLRYWNSLGSAYLLGCILPENSPAVNSVLVEFAALGFEGIHDLWRPRDATQPVPTAADLRQSMRPRITNPSAATSAGLWFAMYIRDTVLDLEERVSVPKELLPLKIAGKITNLEIDVASNWRIDAAKHRMVEMVAKHHGIHIDRLFGTTSGTNTATLEFPEFMSLETNMIIGLIQYLVAIHPRENEGSYPRLWSVVSQKELRWDPLSLIAPWTISEPGYGVCTAFRKVGTDYFAEGLTIVKRKSVEEALEKVRGQAPLRSQFLYPLISRHFLNERGVL
ncbi:hypothetical protein V8F33_013597 [Rhypophila sp. PSN 637]